MPSRESVQSAGAEALEKLINRALLQAHVLLIGCKHTNEACEEYEEVLRDNEEALECIAKARKRSDEALGDVLYRTGEALALISGSGFGHSRRDLEAMAHVFQSIALYKLGRWREAEPGFELARPYVRLINGYGFQETVERYMENIEQRKRMAREANGGEEEEGDTSGWEEKQEEDEVLDMVLIRDGHGALVDMVQRPALRSLKGKSVSALNRDDGSHFI